MQIQSKQAKRYQSELQAARQNAFDEATNTSFWQDKYFTCDQELRTQSRTHLAESKAYSVGFRINDGWRFGKMQTLYGNGELPTLSGKGVAPSFGGLYAKCRIRDRSSVQAWDEKICLTAKTPVPQQEVSLRKKVAAGHLIKLQDKPGMTRDASKLQHSATTRSLIKKEGGRRPPYKITRHAWDDKRCLQTTTQCHNKKSHWQRIGTCEATWHVLGCNTYPWVSFLWALVVLRHCLLMSSYR